MKQRRKYRKRSPVIAVQLDLKTKGFTYEKWGSTQRCSARDWLVKNGRDTYTVQRASFGRTYREVKDCPGQYLKITPIWAEVATRAGQVRTKEGLTRYRRGDYLVSNDYKGSDPYAISKAKFKKMYKPAD
jgi:hypothetical protein